jgi:HK97 gp10 family phage protein
MPKFKVDGLDKLQKALKENVTLDGVKDIVRKNGEQLQRKIERNADFTKGYQTGTTKRSVSLEFENNEFTAVTGSIKPVLNKKTGQPATEYSPYVEYGTRFMDAQPFVKPAFDEQSAKFKKDMQKLVK